MWTGRGPACPDAKDLREATLGWIGGCGGWVPQGPWPAERLESSPAVGRWAARTALTPAFSPSAAPQCSQCEPERKV